MKNKTKLINSFRKKLMRNVKEFKKSKNAKGDLS
jgi:hypothetical protein